MSDEERARLRRAQLQLLGTLVSVAAASWYLIPEWQRRTMVLRGLVRLRDGLRRSARRSADLAMRAELATGRDDGYEVPYALARAGERVQTCITRMTGA